ncbi:MAG TPA: hypothetical protein VKB96_05755 [Gammaproteobacteria bacterium]|nr:hypothetical protein [Gammaproteobacteria bacterium]
MPNLHFWVGERVVLTEALFGFPSGTGGTIVYIYADGPEYYRVRFDTDGQVHPISYGSLASQPFDATEQAREASA